MSVTIRKYQGGDDWEVDIRVLLPDGTMIRERKKAPVSGKQAATRWAEARERELLVNGKPTRRSEEEIAKVRPMTLGEFFPRFIEDAKANQQKPSSIASKDAAFRLHLLPLLGDKPLKDISTEDVQRLKGRLAARAPKTVNNVTAILGVALTTAESWNIIERRICTIKPVKVPKSDAEFYDFDAFERVVASARRDSEQALLVVLLGGEAGLRCGEIMALEWRDIDLAKRQLTVRQSEWKGQVSTPKGNRVRHVPLTLRLTEALKTARHLRNARVLCDPKGESLSQKSVQVLMRRVARRANVKPGVHILRHTFCSHLAMQGAPVRAIQELAGHQDLKTTQRYMHLSPATLDAAIRLLDGDRAHGARGEIVEAAGS